MIGAALAACNLLAQVIANKSIEQMKATEHIASKQEPKITPKEEEPRPPEGMSEIQKQMAKLEAQSLTSDQEDAVTEIRKIIGEVEPPPPPVTRKHEPKQTPEHELKPEHDRGTSHRHS